MISSGFEAFVTIIACIVYTACGLVTFVNLVNVVIHIYHRVTGSAYIERHKEDQNTQIQVTEESRMIEYHQKLIIQNLINMMILFMICVVTFVISYNVIKV